MFNISFPAKHSWSPLSKTLPDAVGYVSGRTFSPYVKAHIYTPATNETAAYTPATLPPGAVTGVSARKQGRWIATCGTGYLSVYEFSPSTGFGSRTSHVAITGIKKARFSQDGSMLIVLTSTGYQIYDFNHGSGLGALLSTSATSVSGTIKSLGVSPDQTHFLISGTAGTVVERRSFDDLNGAGLTCSTAPPAAGSTYSSGGWTIPGEGLCRLSGVCANGVSYYAYTSSRYVYYGTVNSLGLSDPSVIDMVYVTRGIEFVPEYNLLVVGAATDEEGRSYGTDVRVFALSDAPTGLGRGDNVGNFACEGDTSDFYGSPSPPGGAPWSICWIPSQETIIVGLGYGWNNERPYYSLAVASNGTLTAQVYPSYPTAGTNSKGVNAIDWF